MKYTSAMASYFPITICSFYSNFNNSYHFTMSSTLKVQCTLSIFYLDNEIDGEAFCELTQ